uniref:V-set and immunoglobulin domain containing 4 n=1 Tax=Spermophilus dauricus TaxID=99837 RepID=A0A8C9PR85_SPEDA
MLFISFLCSLSSGHPILEGPESVIGPWKGDVNIPCTYGPLKGYTQVLVKWLVQRGSNSVTIFLRDSSGDHIQQAKYRRRLNVSYEVPGDVSLQLNTLEMDDRGHYICEVTWNTPDGTQVVREKIIEFRVQKHSSTPLKTKTEAPTTIQIPLEVFFFLPYFSTLYHLVLSCILGRGLPIFAIILIISLCCVVVITMVYIMLCRKTSQQGDEASDSGETMRVAIYTSGCSSDEPAPRALDNNYSDDPCLGQEYQIIAQINGDYARLLHTVPLDYEILGNEVKSVC